MTDYTSKESNWFDAVNRYNTAMVTLENIRAIAGQSIALHKICRKLTDRQRGREPEKRAFTDLTADEILEHANRMKADLEKVLGFLKEVIK